MSSNVVSIDYFSDVLCVWAYVAQVKVDELRRNFPQRVRIACRFVPVFGNVATKLERGWSARGGLEGYARHVAEVVERFDHVPLHGQIWTSATPAGSLSCHAVLRAASLIEAEGGIDAGPVDEFDGRTRVEELGWRLRLAFFRDGRDISRLDVQLDVAESLHLPSQPIRARLADGTALAALAADHEMAERFQVTGSPTFLLDEGRQKLYGNVGYRIVEANVQELLRDNRELASWC